MLNNMTAYALLSMDFIFREPGDIINELCWNHRFHTSFLFYRFGDLSDHHFVNV